MKATYRPCSACGKQIEVTPRSRAHVADIWPCYDCTTAKRQRGYPDNVRVEEMLGGTFAVLVGGIQHGGKRDASGAGDLDFPTFAEAAQYAREISAD